MDWNWGILAASVVIGFVVGLTGMGGGALTTPILVTFFGVHPLAAVSSDLVSSAITKPFGSYVHMRQGTVHWRIVLWLTIGSVPSAFLGVLLLRVVGGSAAQIDEFVKYALGIALLVGAFALTTRAYVQLVSSTRQKSDARPETPVDATPQPRVALTIALGAAGGLMVGLTSVGAGSLMLIGLMAVYPLLSANRLVGTDLMQSIPLVLAASAGSLLFGSVDWSLTLAVTIGSIPGVIIGATLSSRVSGRLVRRALAVMLLASGLKQLGLSNVLTMEAIVIAFVGGTLVWMLARRSRGLASTARGQRRIVERLAAHAAAERHP